MKAIRFALLLVMLTPVMVLGDDADAITQNIQMLDFRYEPALTKVNLGDDVAWTNNGDVRHNATLRDSMPGAVSVTLEPEASSGPVDFFDAVGRWSYHCTEHPKKMTPGAIGVLIDVDANSKPLFEAFTLTWFNDVATLIHFDIQVKEPGSDRYVTLVKDTRDTSMLYQPPRRGVYRLRGRTQRPTSDESTGFSPPVKITVV
jgi:plastocyanin